MARSAACCNWPGPPYALPQGCNICDTAYCRADMEGRCPNCPRDLVTLLTRDRECAGAVSSAFRSSYDPTSSTGCRSAGSGGAAGSGGSAGSGGAAGSGGSAGSDASVFLYLFPVAVAFFLLRKRR